ncbi:LOW QUALITY PROTEIN: uncharacterized protein LOC132942186 [Metopolophium dirhodum]|uniref:LOW QUALITY PROTEIN: uncharacterized protein LOC132942186 n=1 Tax=Metopolophium dirhodum TaxID=44670 RepID=UPI00298F6293|nr:LOW QUALITY PROTEIN: uncharacterized protein LOC132942186 [Metopolophium dirhodum]
MDNKTVQINSEITHSPITWYSHFCDECKHLSVTESALKNHELQHHPFWSKGGDVMFCQIYSEDDDGTSGAMGDEEALSAVWYLAAFGGLVLFFFVVTCSELFFGNPIYQRRPVELPHAGYLRRHVYGIRNHGQHHGGNYKPETPPPPYHLFAPPSYDDTVKGGFGQVLQQQQQQQQQQQPQQYHHRVPGKKLADVYVVPVHAATTAATGATTCAAGATTCATCTTNAVAVAVADAKLLAAVLPQTKFK